MDMRSKPMQSPPLPARCKPEMRIPAHTAVNPGGGVAEALANVIPPVPGAAASHPEIFLHARGFAQFPLGPRPDFVRKQTGILTAQWVTEPYPNEMKQFVKQN